MERWCIRIEQRLEGRQLESKNDRHHNLRNFRGATCRDSFLMAQAYPKPGRPLRARESLWQGCDVLPALEKWTPVFNSGRIEFVDLLRFWGPNSTGNVDTVRALIESEGFSCC
jgi:hypothetical protein